MGASGRPFRRPGPRAGATRSSWPPASSARSPVARTTAARPASALPGSRPAKPSRNSTSTTSAPSNTTRSCISARSSSWQRKRTWCSWGRPAPARPTCPSASASVPARPPPGRVRYRRRMGRLPRRRPRAGAPPPGTRPARADPAAGRRRGRLHPLRRRSRQPLLPAHLRPLRTRLGHRHQQQTVRPLGVVFGDPVVAAAMIDRLVHHAEVVSLKGDSYRLRNRDLGRVPADDAA